MSDSEPESLFSDSSGPWTVFRIDDNGNTFVVREHLSRE